MSELGHDPTDCPSSSEQLRRFQIARLLIDRNLREVAEDLEVSVRTVERWVETGVGWRTADRIAATILNEHAVVLFGPEWAEAAAAGAPEPTLFDDDLSDLTPRSNA